MKIALLQQDIVWNEAQANIERVESLMSAAHQADLYVLPEMWATGFIVEPDACDIEESSCEALRWMMDTAKTKDCAICGSLAVKDENAYFNRHFFATPDAVFSYDKHHLFTHGNEHLSYRAGQEHIIAEWRGVRFLLQTCYDLRFPVWSRYGVAGTYDAIIYVANWPQPRANAWQVLLQARAIENQCYVIGVNRVGDDPKCHYAGDSMFVGPIGRIEGVCKKNAEQTLEVMLSMDVLKKSRERFKVLADRDSYPMV